MLFFRPRCFLSRSFMASQKPGGRLLFRAGGCGRVRLRKTRPFITWVTACPNWGIVLSGSVFVENTDLWGNRSILSKITPGQVFAETYAFCREPMMVNVTAAEASTVLFFNLQNLDQTADGDDAWLSQLRSNMLRISMQKNLTLSNRIFCTTPKTIRERVLVYLAAQSAKTGADTFTIPFDRQGLADYLNLDRSALSKELGKMQKEGILEFHKNKFTLRHPSL